jgi:hypothetical protein
MAIFDQVRATAPLRQLPMTGQHARDGLTGQKIRPQHMRNSMLTSIGTVPAGAVAGIPGNLRSSAGRQNTTSMSLVNRVKRFDTLSWISSFKQERASEAGGSASGTDSGAGSRVASRSRPPSRGVFDRVTVNEITESEARRRSSSRDIGDGYSLRDEIATSLNRLARFKVKLEKVPFWGISTSISVS